MLLLQSNTQLKPPRAFLVSSLVGNNPERTWLPYLPAFAGRSLADASFLAIDCVVKPTYFRSPMDRLA